MNYIVIVLNKKGLIFILKNSKKNVRFVNLFQQLLGHNVFKSNQIQLKSDLIKSLMI